MIILISQNFQQTSRTPEEPKTSAQEQENNHVLPVSLKNFFGGEFIQEQNQRIQISSQCQTVDKGKPGPKD